MPAGWELWLDGGHNPGAGEVVAAAVSAWRDRPLELIVGMLNTKNAAGFLAPLAPHARALHAVTIPGEDNPLPADAIAAAARSVGLPAEESPSVAAALAPHRRYRRRRKGADLRLAPPRRHRPCRQLLTDAGNASRSDFVEILNSAAVIVNDAGYLNRLSSPSRKRGSRACSWPEQGEIVRARAPLGSRCRGNDE